MKRPLVFLVFPLYSLMLLSCSRQTADNTYVREVIGEYFFDTFQFVPESSALETVNVMDTLVYEETRLQLFSSKRFTLLYRFKNGSPAFVGGDFEVSRSRVVLKGNPDDEEFYAALLLPTEIPLQRSDDPDVLTGSIKRRVNLEAFSPRYRGLLSVRGTLVLELRRR